MTLYSKSHLDVIPFNIKTRCDNCQKTKWCFRIPFRLAFYCRKCYDKGMICK